MSFLNKLFGKKEKPSRTLTSPSELNIGDIIELTDSFALPENLRKQEFKVKAINSYEFEHHVDTEWVLIGNHDIELYLSLEIDDKAELKFSLKIEHHDVETLFDLDAFSTVFDQDETAELSIQQETELTSGWTDPHYHQTQYSTVGYFHRKDNRTEQLSAFEGQDAGEQFELYVLYNDEQTRGIDIEVWDDGETDVFLTLYRPISDIVNYYPGS